MNWRDQPHLFANGKFDIKYETGNNFEVIGIGYNQYSDKPEFLCWNYSGQIIDRDIDKCTLIARPIADMTDEEKEEITARERENDSEPTLYDWEFDWHGVSENTDNNKISLFLYLLSIGVYPFDQSHFDTGDVIPTNTREGE